MLNLKKDLSNLVGADYNPRKINENDLTALCESIKDLGLVKPLICRGNLLVAGHQRSKALLQLGINHAPVYELPCETTKYDEVRFNQLHNGTDLDCGEEQCSITGGFKELGYQTTVSKNIEGNLRCKLAGVRGEICKLILKYGSWGGAVATMSGEVIHCAQYALACKITGYPLTVYVIKDSEKERYQKKLNKEYGVFSYDHLKKDTFIQTFAQMFRLRGDTNSSAASSLYEGHAIPYIQKDKKLRCVDFGSGQGDYAKMLRSKGFNVIDIALLSDIDKNGLFDVVICDSVMNSVDSVQAECDVMTMINTLCKKGGSVFFSGRARERINDNDNLTKSADKVRYVEFIDEHGFSALYRKGRWFYQKFHTKEQVVELCDTYGLKFILQKNKHGSSWQCEAIKQKQLSLAQIETAIKNEFNMKINDVDSLNKGDVAWKSFRAHLN